MNNENRIKNAYNEALALVQNFKEQYRIQCSENIIWGGFNDETSYPIKIVFNRNKNIFIMFYSKHYINNRISKITKMILRHIVYTNDDGTFKNIKQTKDELKKITHTYFEATFMAGYLQSDITNQMDAYCEKCKRRYTFKDDNIKNNIKEFKCECGGEIILANSDDSIFNDKRKADMYFNKDYKRKSKKKKLDISFYPKDLYDEFNCDDETYNWFQNIITNNSRITRLVMIPEIEKAVGLENVTLLKMFNKSFDKVYASCYRQVNAYYKRKMTIMCEPTTVANAHKLHRKDFNCSDDVFIILQKYYTQRKSVKQIKLLIREAYTNKNEELIRELYQFDPDNYKKADKYLPKSIRRYSDEVLKYVVSRD